MISYHSKILLNVLNSALILATMDANDEECTTELQMRRNTIYEAFLGQELRINCPVLFCHNLPPKVNRYKNDDTLVRVNNNNHLKIGWETGNPREGISYLIFQNILRSDSGVYRCESGGSVSHSINITVIDNTEPTTTPSSHLWTSLTTERSVTRAIFWPCMFRVITIGAFFLIVITTCVTSKAMLRGTCRKTAEPCSQTSDENYEDV